MGSVRNLTRNILLGLLVVATGCATSRYVRPDPVSYRAGASPGRGAADSPARAAGDLAAEVDLPLLLESAARDNPRLGAARSRWQAARQRGTIARSLPDPMLTYTEMLEPVETRVGPMQRTLTLSQGIPFPAKLQAAGAVADEQACAKELEYHIALRDTFAELKVSYAELVYLHRALAIVEQNQALAKQLAEKAAAGYAKEGEAPDALSLFDALKAQSSLAQLAYDVITLRELLRSEETKLNALLSRSADAPLGAPRGISFRPLEATQAQLIALAHARRQEIQAALHRVRAAQHGRRLAQLSRVPDFKLGVQYTSIGAATTPVAGSGDDAVGLQLGVTLPIWGRKNRAKIEEARQLERAARFEQQREKDEVASRLSRVFFRLQNAERLVRLYGESLIPQAESALSIAEQWHDVGRDTFARLLEARSVWLNFQLAHQRALADHEQMVARLEQLVGVSLGHLRGEVAR